MKAATLVFCMECLETQVPNSSMINLRKFSALFLWRAAFRLYQAVRNIQTTLQLSQLTGLRRNIRSQVLRSEHYLSDPGVCRIPCYTLLHRTEVMFFYCGLKVAKYHHRLTTIKNSNIGIGPKTPYRSSST